MWTQIRSTSSFRSALLAGISKIVGFKVLEGPRILLGSFTSQLFGGLRRFSESTSIGSSEPEATSKQQDTLIAACVVDFSGNKIGDKGASCTPDHMGL